MSIIRKVKRGFSAAELLVAMAVVGALAGMLFLTFGPSSDKAKASTCYTNRTTILLALKTYRYSEGLSKENYSLDKFITEQVKVPASNNYAKCPSGGIYSALSGDVNEVVVCSKHTVTSAPSNPTDPPPPSGGCSTGLPLMLAMLALPLFLYRKK